MLRRVKERSRAALTASAALVALSGCSLGADEERSRTEPLRGASKEVAATVQALDRAVRKRDWRAVCDRLFTSAARERAGGKDCARLASSSAGALRGPRIELVGIEVSRGGAQARVRTQARGQAPLIDTLTLRRVGGRYRIESLR
jgi:hypothetical protein